MKIADENYKLKVGDYIPRYSKNKKDGVFPSIKIINIFQIKSIIDIDGHISIGGNITKSYTTLNGITRKGERNVLLSISESLIFTYRKDEITNSDIFILNESEFLMESDIFSEDDKRIETIGVKSTLIIPKIRGTLPHLLASELVSVQPPSI